MGLAKLGGRLGDYAALSPVFVAGNAVCDLLFQATLLLIHAIARPPTLSLITELECDKPTPPDS